jgi:hypothetical protein
MDRQETVRKSYIAAGRDDGAGKFYKTMKTAVVGLEVGMGAGLELKCAQPRNDDRPAALNDADAGLADARDFDYDGEGVTLVENVHRRFPIAPCWSRVPESQRRHDRKGVADLWKPTPPRGCAEVSIGVAFPGFITGRIASGLSGGRKSFALSGGAG